LINAIIGITGETWKIDGSSWISDIV